jgi:NADH-quinone oxidoreductase subunit F
MKLGAFDPSGRRRPENSDQDVVIDADQIILAVGQSLDASHLKDLSAPELMNKDRIVADPITGQTALPWLFAGGDVVTGPWSVVSAVAGGERGAVGIDAYLTGQNHAFWRTDQANDTVFDPEADPLPYPRTSMPLLSVARRRTNFDEVEQPWTEHEAVRQAKRCLRCDYGKQESAKGAVHT